MMQKVEINGKILEVSDKIQVGKAYIHKGVVYAVHKQEPKGAGIYIKDGKPKIKPYPKGKEIKEDAIVAETEPEMDLFDEILRDKDTIIKGSEKPVLTKEEKSDVFAPPINDDDNLLVRIVKSVLKERQINIKILLPKFKDQMEMNNFKRSLRIHNKMSIERFEKWMEVLDCDWDITYKCKSKNE
jgi:hypothetical protein